MPSTPGLQPGEDMPLLPSVPPDQRSGAGKITVEVEDDDSMVEEDEEEEDEEFEEDIVFADRRRRSTSLVLNDSVLLVLQYLQIYALLQSLALRWPWPLSWLQNLRFVFLVNLDVWEFMKMQTNNTYKSVQGHFTPSASVGVEYWHILVAWGALLFLALLCHLMAYAIITYRHRATMLVQLASLQRAYLVLAQVITIPMGVVLARLFHCTDLGKVDVINDLQCFEGYHWAYIAPALVVTVLFFVALPIWLILRTRAEMVDLTPDRHEGYLQLKEAEYIQGLDLLWIVGGFHIFSSFKKRGSQLRATLHILLAIVLAVYAGMFRLMFAQALLLTLLLFVIWLAFVIIRPYRVTAFNLLLIMSYLCLVGNGLLGCLKLLYNPTSLASPWLTPAYLTVLLAIINGFWLLFALIFIIYLLAHHCKCCSYCHLHPLWPSMTSDGLKRVSPTTRKYVNAILHGKIVAEKCLAMPALFAPAHELARQIHIINAYCREAEHYRDSLHNTLWDTLDELIEAHGRVAPQSLFAESVKDSIRQTATELLHHLPGFVRRLAQREYDYLLVNPVKRRMLLKMYCMGLFLNGRRDQVEREQVTLPAAQKIWTRNQHGETDDGYFEDMNPEPEPGASLRPQTVVSLDMFSPAAIDDELAIKEAEQWTTQHPLSRGIPNLAFQDDISLLDGSIEAFDADVPSQGSINSNRPTSSQSLLPPGGQVRRPSGTQSVVPSSGEISRPVSASGSRPGSKQQPEPHEPTTSRSASMLSVRPGSATSLRPGSALSHTRPGSASSHTRPGSASSHTRPGSASSGVEPMRNSPLPGQVDDLEEDPNPSV